MTKSKIILISAIAIAGSTASLLIQHEARIRFSENDAVLRQQDNQFAALAAEHERVSSVVAQVKSSPLDRQQRELQKLRIDAERLRKQINELGAQRTENRQSHPAQTNLRSRSYTHDFPAMVSVVSDSNSEEYAKQLERMTYDKMGDIRHLSSAVREYAREHQGEFPTNFDQAAPYFYEFQAQANRIHEQLRKLADSPAPPKEVYLRDLVADKGESGAPPKQQESSRINEFELVYQGSYNELTNVPWQEVALIRERQPWPTPSGKWARIYVMAGGKINVVESDDSFQSWEAEHIVPPPAAGQ